MQLTCIMGDESRNKNGTYVPFDTRKQLPFHLNTYGEFYSDAHYFTERQGEQVCLLMATISGCGILRYAGKEKLLPPGTAAVINCSQYQYYATRGEEWHFVWMHFTGTAAEPMVQMMNGGGLRVMKWEVWRAEEMFGTLEEMTRNPSQQADFILSLWIHQILNELFQFSGDESVQQYQEEMTGIAEYMRENLSRPFQVAELAARSGLSEYHFSRVFKKVIGRSPYDYLMYLRVSRAGQLLAGTDRSAADIAAEVGYSDLRGLIENFKKHTGLTPANFRKQTRMKRNLPESEKLTKNRAW